MLQRIPKCYVIEDAVQIRVSFDKKITIISSDFNNEGILCHYNLDDDSQNINKYINDQRRKNFPFGNIPIYKEIQLKFTDSSKIINYVNQIMNFNKHYISIIGNGYIKDRYIVQDGEEAIAYSRMIDIPENTNQREISSKSLFEKYCDNVICCITWNGHHIDFIKNFDIFLNDNGGLVVLNKDNHIQFRLVRIIYKSKFITIKEYDIPFNDYQLEELKAYNPKIKKVSEPKIYSKFNPNIEQKEVRVAKKLVKKLNK